MDWADLERLTSDLKVREHANEEDIPKPDQLIEHATTAHGREKRPCACASEQVLRILWPGWLGFVLTLCAKVRVRLQHTCIAKCQDVPVNAYVFSAAC